jgi:sugar phosphate isomerase/epimerase
MPVVSLAALTVLDAGPAGQIRAAAEAGFESVGLRLNPLLSSDEAVVGDMARQREIEDLLHETGLKVLEIGVFPIRPDTNIDELAPVLAFSHKIGARYLVCPVEDTDPSRRVATFARLCEMAASCALTGLIEFNPYSACPNLDAALAIVQAAEAENSGLVIDALHLSRSGGSPVDLMAVPAPLLPLVHLCDAPPPPTGQRTIEELRAESRTARLLPGEGSLWLDELLSALPADVAISVEAPTARDAGLPAAEGARRALDATRNLLARHIARSEGR